MSHSRNRNRRPVQRFLTREVANTPYWFLLAASIGLAAIGVVVATHL
ncbi:hypothetical protein ACWPKO_25655 (plasmid) [Coraliomargarita sp. W4R53]